MTASSHDGFERLKTRLRTFLQTWQGKVAAAGVVLVVLLIALFAFSSHSPSYQRGHDAGLGDIPADPNPGDWCRESLSMARLDHPNTDSDDFTDGCMDGIKDRNK